MQNPENVLSASDVLALTEALSPDLPTMPHFNDWYKSNHDGKSWAKYCYGWEVNRAYDELGQNIGNYITEMVAGLSAAVIGQRIVRTVEAAVLARLRQHDVEDLIDRAYREFTAMRDGAGEFQGEPWAEADAFKAHMRRFAYARYHELIGQVLRAQGAGAPRA